MKLAELFVRKPVLTRSDIIESLRKEYSRNDRSQEYLIRYHLREGHLLQVRRGLFVVVPKGDDPKTTPVDPYLVAGKMAADATLAYHTAMEFHGKAYSVYERFYFQSNKCVRPTTFRTYRFERVPFAKALRDKGKEHFATKVAERSGVEIRVASLERCLVDLHDRPKRGGGWEEIWRCLESVEYFDLDVVLAYTKLLGNATTAAKVGYYLERHAELLMVEERHLAPLRRLRPKQPHYLERGTHGKLVPGWNLVVPDSLVERSWEEFA